MKIRDIMNDDLRCITEDGSVQEAAELMKQVDCGVLPIVQHVNSRHPIGVLTDRDIVLRCVVAGRDCAQTTVGEIASRKLVTCDETCSVADAFERMRENDVGRLLVTDDRGELIGIVSMASMIARVPREIFDQLPGAEESLPRQRMAA